MRDYTDEELERQRRYIKLRLTIKSNSEHYFAEEDAKELLDAFIKTNDEIFNRFHKELTSCTRRVK